MRRSITNAKSSGGVGGESSYLACSTHVGCVETRLRTDAYAFWLREPGYGEVRSVTLPEPEADDVLVRTLRSGVSRGTETLVFRAGVPAGQYAAMRAPFQEREFAARTSPR